MCYRPWAIRVFICPPRPAAPGRVRAASAPRISRRGAHADPAPPRGGPVARASGDVGDAPGGETNEKQNHKANKIQQNKYKLLWKTILIAKNTKQVHQKYNTTIEH